MNEHRTLKQYIYDQFDFLTTNYGFSPKIEENNVWDLTITYLYKKNIAIEVSIDWRDIGFTVLVVKLHNGKIPNGYYVNNGEVIRKHLIQVAQEIGGNKAFITEIQSLIKASKVRDEDFLRNLIDEYVKLTKSCLEIIIEQGSNLFY